MLIKQEIVDIAKIEESPINAHFESQEEFTRLVKNLRKDGTLTSAVLLMEQPDKKYMCISGHHRIKAALKAGISQVPAVIIPPVLESKRIALQLSHNDIQGADDPDILSQMVERLEKEDLEAVDPESLSIEQRKELEKIEYEVAHYHYVNICFLPETVMDFEAMIDDLGGEDEDLSNYLIPGEDYEKVKELLTMAHRAGFKTPGQAFRHFLDIAARYVGGEIVQD